MGAQAHLRNIGGFLAGHEGSAKPQTAADATDIVGAIIDRLSTNQYESALVIVNLAFTAASGATGAKQTITLQMYDDDAAAMGTEATYGSALTFEIAWDTYGNGAHSVVACFPVNLSSAKQYVRAKAKVTESGTITISSQSMSIAVICPANPAPDADYSASGWGSVAVA